MFDKILIATDNSSLMKDAIQYSAKLFPYSDYHLINVINTRDSSIPQTKLFQSRMAEISQEALDEGEKILTDMGIDEVKKSNPRGVPSQEIINYIECNDIELLIMATHSKTGAQTLHIGDTAIHSLQVTKIPSLIFSCRCSLKTPKRIFNPTTFSTYSIDASMLALELAEYLEASLTTYHIGEEDIGPIPRKIKNRASKAGVDFKLEINKNASEERIIEKSREFDFIVGSRGRSGWRYKLRHIFRKFALSNLEKALIEGTDVPYLMVGD